MKKSLICSLLVFVSVCIAAQDVSLCESYYEDAEEAFKKGDYKLAQSYYKLVAAECSDNYANCKARLRACEKAIASTPKDKEKKSPEKELTKPGNFKSDKKYVSFTQYGGKEKVKISSKNSWDVKQSPYWIRVLRDHDIITLSCDTNYNQSPRQEDIILIDNSNEEYKITINQAKNSDYLRLSHTIIDDREGHGGTYLPIRVTCNTDWYVQEHPVWAEVKTIQSEIVVTLERNETGRERDGKIVLVSRSNRNIQDEISVTQGVFQHYLELSHTRFSDKKGEGSISLPFYVKTDYGKFRIENCPEWCEIVDRTSSSFSIRIIENKGREARNAHLKVVAGDLSEDLFVSQVARPFYINVDPPIITAPAGTEGIELYKICHVETNCGTWEVVNAPDWCQVEEIDDKTFKIKIKNNDGGPRTATFYVATRECKCEMTIEQD